MTLEQAEIIVEITDQVSTFTYNGKTCHPGDKIAIPTRLFRSDFMRKIAEVRTETIKAVVTVPVLPVPEPELAPPPTEKKGKK